MSGAPRQGAPPARESWASYQLALLGSSRVAAMEVHVLEALSDNYMYLVVDSASKSACVVDPVDPGTIMDAAKRLGATITTVLTTHHHYDHAGGNNEMKKLVAGVQVVGGENDNVEGCTKKVRDGECLQVGSLTVECVHTPCHTNGHTCYAARSATGGAPAALFTGDFLFVGGCGRFFEGSPEQMVAGLRLEYRTSSFVYAKDNKLAGPGKDPRPRQKICP